MTRRLIIGLVLVFVAGMVASPAAAAKPTGTITGPIPADPTNGDTVTFTVVSDADNQWVSVWCWVPGSEHSSATLLFGSQQSHTLGNDVFGPLPGPAECIAELWTFGKRNPPTHKVILDTVEFVVT